MTFLDWISVHLLRGVEFAVAAIGFWLTILSIIVVVGIIVGMATEIHNSKGGRR
jgi:uncharacterized membrane protein